MQHNRIQLITLVLISAIALLLISSCKRDEEDANTKSHDNSSEKQGEMMPDTLVNPATSDSPEYTSVESIVTAVNSGSIQNFLDLFEESVITKYDHIDETSEVYISDELAMEINSGKIVYYGSKYHSTPDDISFGVQVDQSDGRLNIGYTLAWLDSIGCNRSIEELEREYIDYILLNGGSKERESVNQLGPQTRVSAIYGMRTEDMFFTFNIVHVMENEKVKLRTSKVSIQYYPFLSEK